MRLGLVKKGLLIAIGCFSALLNALELTGPLQQGGMVIGRVEPGSKVFLDQQTIKSREALGTTRAVK